MISIQCQTNRYKLNYFFFIEYKGEYWLVENIHKYSLVTGM